jgi:hypothetical protein
VLDTRGTSSVTTGSTTTISFTNVPPPGPQSYVIVVVGIASSAAVTGVVAGTGTFVFAGAVNAPGLGKRVEIWLGYNFGTSYPTTVTVTRTGTGTNNVGVVRVLDLFANTSTAPTIAANAGSTATSTTADSGSVTPAVGDLLVVARVSANTVSTSSRTHTGSSYVNPAGAAVTATLVDFGYAEALAAVASSESWTLTSSGEWAAIQVKITPPAPPTPTAAILLKGLTTQALDAASAY